MKRLIILAALLPATAYAQVNEKVSGYERSNGTYVQPYERTAPDNTVMDNYSHQGNTNPYTGQEGHETGGNGVQGAGHGRGGEF